MLNLELRQYTIETVISMLKEGKLNRVGKPDGVVSCGNVKTASEVLLNIFGREICLPSLNIWEDRNTKELTLYDDTNKIQDLYVFITKAEHELNRFELEALLNTVLPASVTRYTADEVR